MNSNSSDECQVIEEIECPCCEGCGEHFSGGERNNPNEISWDCQLCRTAGWLAVGLRRKIKRYERVNGVRKEVGEIAHRTI